MCVSERAGASASKHVVERQAAAWAGRNGAEQL